MTAVLNGLVIGLLQGGTYGLIALGIVLVYKGSKVLNFAQAEIGSASLFITYWLTNHGVSYWFAALAAVAFGIAVGIGFERAVVNRMGNAPRLTVAVGTIGLFALLFSAEFYFFGGSTYFIRKPIAGTALTVGLVRISWMQVIAYIAIGAITLALTQFLRRTDFGLGVVAAAQDATAVRLLGIPLARVSMFTWGVAGALSVVAAHFIQTTITSFGPGAIGEPLFIGGLAAALLGGLGSLSGAFVGGLLVGVVQAEVSLNGPSGVSGLSAVVLFAIIMAVLLVRPQGLLGRVAGRAEMAT